MPKPSAESSPSETFSNEPSSVDINRYIGRFAPSPSGPLHHGSLIAALASFLDAKANDGLWYVRMEDLDPPRESPEAAQQILKSLEQLHLYWDGEVLYQSQRHSVYEAALAYLHKAQLTFPCTCTRQEIQKKGGVHQGICAPQANKPVAIRFCCPNQSLEFNDIIQGHQIQNLKQDAGDFVVHRKDGFYAYQLAVVVDDAFQNISHVIRGIDLLDSTGRQMCLQSALNLARPLYGHIPVIVNELGQKLSKQHFARAIDMTQPKRLLLTALQYLQQAPSPDLVDASLDEILTWAIDHWDIKPLIGSRSMTEFEPAV